MVRTVYLPLQFGVYKYCDSGQTFDIRRTHETLLEILLLMRDGIISINKHCTLSMLPKQTSFLKRNVRTVASDRNFTVPLATSQVSYAPF